MAQAAMDAAYPPCVFPQKSSTTARARQPQGPGGRVAPASSATKRACAKRVNARLMSARHACDIFSIVMENMEHLDAINTTAALQRLAKLLDQPAASGRRASSEAPRDGDGERGSAPGATGRAGAAGRGEQDPGSLHACGEAAASRAGAPAALRSALRSPAYEVLVSLMVRQCHRGDFNSQSTANAWWAASRLCAPDRPPGRELLDALEQALRRCLLDPREAARPNAQAVSSVWYAWGRLAGAGALPVDRRAVDLLWDRSGRLAHSLDAQGVANLLWAWGALRRAAGESFEVRRDVLARVALVVERAPGAFAAQGLSCAAMGAANVGAALRPVVLPLLAAVVREAVGRAREFNLQAMANLAAAVARVGGELRADPSVLAMLAAFDRRAAALAPPGARGQEVASLAAAMLRCGHAASAPALADAQAGIGGRWAGAEAARADEVARELSDFDLDRDARPAPRVAADAPAPAPRSSPAARPPSLASLIDRAAALVTPMDRLRSGALASEGPSGPPPAAAAASHAAAQAHWLHAPAGGLSALASAWEPSLSARAPASLARGPWSAIPSDYASDAPRPDPFALALSAQSAFPESAVALPLYPSPIAVAPSGSSSGPSSAASWSPVAAPGSPTDAERGFDALLACREAWARTDAAEAAAEAACRRAGIFSPQAAASVSDALLAALGAAEKRA